MSKMKRLAIGLAILAPLLVLVSGCTKYIKYDVINRPENNAPVKTYSHATDKESAVNEIEAALGNEEIALANNLVFEALKRWPELRNDEWFKELTAEAFVGLMPQKMQKGRVSND